MSAVSRWCESGSMREPTWALLTAVLWASLCRAGNPRTAVVAIPGHAGCLLRLHKLELEMQTWVTIWPTTSCTALSLSLLNQTWLMFGTTHFIPLRRPRSQGLPDSCTCWRLSLQWHEEVQSPHCLRIAWGTAHWHPDGQVNHTAFKQFFPESPPTNILWGRDAVSVLPLQVTGQSSWETAVWAEGGSHAPGILSSGVHTDGSAVRWAGARHLWATWRRGPGTEQPAHAASFPSGPVLLPGCHRNLPQVWEAVVPTTYLTASRTHKASWNNRATWWPGTAAGPAMIRQWLPDPAARTNVWSWPA